MDHHHALIRFYKGYIAEHPDCRNAYLWLMDQTLDAEQLEESRHYLDAYARIDQNYRISMYEGK